MSDADTTCVRRRTVALNVVELFRVCRSESQKRCEMRRRITSIIAVCSLTALAITLAIWPVSYRTTVGYIWTTGSFLLEGKENVDSHFGVTAAHGILRVEQFVTRVPATQPVVYENIDRLQTTRATAPLWFFAIAWSIIALVAWLARRSMISGQPNDD